MVGKSRKLRYGAAVAVGAAAMMLVSSCGVVAGDSGQETVLVGVDLELTGDDSELGSIYHDALQMRVEQVNQQGLLGDRELELRVMDNRSDPETSVSNLTELFNDPSVVAIVTGQCADCLVSAADTLDSHVVPAISLSNSDAAIESPEHAHHLFKLGPNADHNAGALATELRREGVGTIAVVGTTDQYGEAGMQQMAEAADRAGIEVVVSEQISDEESVRAAASAIGAYRPEGSAGQNQADQTGPPDGGAQTGQVAQTQQPDGSQSEDSAEVEGPDAVVVWAPERLAGELAVTLRDDGYEGDFFLDASAADELFLSGEASAALDGARMIFTETLVIDDVIATSPAKAARQNWFRDYLARNGTYHAYASFAADAVQLIVEGVNRFDTVDPDSVRAAIEATQVEGLTGPLRMDSENHSGLMPQALTTVVARGDRWRLAA